LRSQDFNSNVQKAFKSYNKDFSQLTTLMEDQQKLKLEKYNYIKDEAEKSHKRDVNLIKKIDSNNKNWKKEYGAKKK